MTKHTLGPWTVSELDALGNVSEYYIFIEPNVAVIERKIDGRNANDLNDARLIAAAPELLEALEFALRDMEATRAQFLSHAPNAGVLAASIAQARAAISKATGG